MDTCNIEVIGRDFEITPALQQYAIDKITTSLEYFTNDCSIDVITRVETIGSQNVCDYLISITAHPHSKFFDSTYRVECKENDPYAAIDMLCDVLYNQLRKSKEKKIDVSRCRHAHNKHVLHSCECCERGEELIDAM